MQNGSNRYITWVRQNPDSFELLVRKNIAGFRGRIDFSNPRIICFAQEFSIDDKSLALSLSAELWKYRYYENQTMIITREEESEQLIRNKETGTASIRKIAKEPRKARSAEGEFRDPHNLTEPIPRKHGYGKITHQMHFAPREDSADTYVDDIMDILFQSYAATQ